MERVGDTVDPRAVPGLIRRAWSNNPVVVVGTDSAGREICQAGQVLLLVYRSNSKTVVVTVLGRVDEAALPVVADLSESREEARWRRNQRLQSVGQMHRNNWQLRREQT